MMKIKLSVVVLWVGLGISGGHLFAEETESSSSSLDMDVMNQIINNLSASQEATNARLITAIDGLSDATKGVMEEAAKMLLTELQDLFKGYLGTVDFSLPVNQEVSYVLDSDGEKISHLRATLKGLWKDYYYYTNNRPAGGAVVPMMSDADLLTEVVAQDKKKAIQRVSVDDLLEWPDNAALSTQSDTVTYYDLIGKNGYGVEDEKDARSFITELLKSFEPLREVQMTDNKIIIPMSDGEGNSSTSFYFTKGTDAEYPVGEYSEAVKMLQARDFYTDYLKKQVATSRVRGVYAEAFINAYQERKRSSGDDSTGSLLEQETMLVKRGINQAYYEAMQNKSAAEVNLELLYSLNKVAYFLQRLHRSNERLSLLFATTALQFSGKGTMDENNYLNPMKVLVENKCWLKENESLDICVNPMVNSMVDTGVSVDEDAKEMFSE